MNSDLQYRLLGAVYACLRPLARILLRSGVTYASFANVAKRAFVHEAMLERDTKGRLANVSRVAVRTGLSRKEVRRLSLGSDEKAGVVDHAGPPARVLHSWYFDRRFLSAAGLPLDLEFEDGDPNFADLVRVAGGDVPAGAVRSELLRTEAIIELPNGALRPAKRYYIPADFNEKAIIVLTDLLYPVIAGLEHNSNPARRKDAGYIQRFAYSKLPPERRDEFRLWSREEASKFVERMDDWLLAHDGDIKRDDPIVSGMGVFFFEGLQADLLPVPKAKEVEENNQEGRID